MSVRMEPAVGVVVPEAVDKLAIDVDWQAVCDQVRAALHRTWLPVYGGSVRAELVAARLGARGEPVTDCGSGCVGLVDRRLDEVG